VGVEVAGEELGGDIGHLTVAVARMARMGQGVLVGVRGVDLDPRLESLLTERLGEQHGDRVGLLAAGAAGTPNPDG